MGTVEDLLSLAAGGGSVARHLLDEENQLQSIGLSPAGVDLAVKTFLQAIEKGQQALLFMVGGPGGGKSHAAKRIVSNFEEIDKKSSMLAHRVHNYRHAPSGSQITVINDATIGEDLSTEFPLVNDLHSAVQNGRSMICCVNRGVLVEESRCADPQFTESVRVISNISAGFDPESAKSENSTSNLTSYFYWYEEEIEGKRILVIQLSFDICSLFEDSIHDDRFIPASNSTGSLQEMSIARFRDRYGSGELSSNAAILLDETVNLVTLDLAPTTLGSNPIAANLHSLSQSNVVNGLVSIARAAEIAEGQRLTYRELWSFVSKAILGDAGDAIDKQSLIEHTKTPAGDASFKVMAELAGSRFSQALFSVRFGDHITAKAETSNDPVSNFLKIVDPVRDMSPGIFKPSEGMFGWATPINEAFTGSAEEVSPLKELLTLDSQSNGVMQHVVHEFDWDLDKSFSKAVSDPLLDSKTRNSYISWYAGYLARLCAVSNGVPAFLSVIDAWTELWNKAPLIPEEIRSKLLTLAKPSRNPENKSSSTLIPLFDSRTVPVIGENSSPKLALKVDDVVIKTSKQANNLFLELGTGNEFARLILDFSLLREAMASAAGYAGVTESSSLAAPRLERFRASILVAKAKRNYVVMYRDKEVEFQVESESE